LLRCGKCGVSRCSSLVCPLLNNRSAICYSLEEHLLTASLCIGGGFFRSLAGQNCLIKLNARVITRLEGDGSSTARQERHLIRRPRVQLLRERDCGTRKGVGRVHRAFCPTYCANGRCDSCMCLGNSL
jgi:hypothetical protein